MMFIHNYNPKMENISNIHRDLQSLKIVIRF